MSNQSTYFMQQAIELGRKGMTEGLGGPFGCVIVKDNIIVGKGHNSVLQLNDPTAHAEVMAIRDACSTLGTFQLSGCEIYTSCEPCPMCMGAINWARPLRVFYAATKDDAADAGFDDSFIYDQLNLPGEQREIPFQQLSTTDASILFAEWKTKADKTVY